MWQILPFSLAFRIRLRWVWVYVATNVWCLNCLLCGFHVVKNMQWFLKQRELDFLCGRCGGNNMGGPDAPAFPRRSCTWAPQTGMSFFFSRHHTDVSKNAPKGFVVVNENQIMGVGGVPMSAHQSLAFKIKLYSRTQGEETCEGNSTKVTQFWKLFLINPFIFIRRWNCFCDDEISFVFEFSKCSNTYNNQEWGGTAFVSVDSSSAPSDYSRSELCFYS